MGGASHFERQIWIKSHTMAEVVESYTYELPSCLAGIDIVSADGALQKVVSATLQACALIGANLRNGSYSSNAIGTTNEFGDQQLDVDVKADAVLFGAFRDCGVVAIASSEENPHEVLCGGTGYSVAFDPLDGSSVIDANFAVGTIVGIWPGSTLLNRTGRELACSILVQYGPRVTAAIAFNAHTTSEGKPMCLEITLQTTGWVVSMPKICIVPIASTFAPGNLRATSDNPQYKCLVDYWIEKQYTLRYSGGLVPDVYHIFMKGQGVLCNASSKKSRAKLRLLYECAPIALIVEAAGGASCVCPSEEGEPMEPVSLLDVLVDHLDRRVGVCFGSVTEVERFKSYIFSDMK